MIATAHTSILSVKVVMAGTNEGLLLITF